MTDYDPEVYWSRVAQEIGKRGDNYIAGDDNPYYRYKRRKFLKAFLDTIDFQSKSVLEVGFGPGGNLKHLAMHHAPKRIFGADVSQKMLEVAAKNLGMHDITLVKTDGANLPFPDQAVDISFTVTVLQHNTDGRVFKGLVQELCRVTKTMIVIMEDIGEAQIGDGDWIGRPVEIYRSVFAECGFELSNVKFLNTKFSRSWYQFIYRHFISSRHQEGDPISPAVKYLIGLPMPITSFLDEMFVEKGGLAKMVFQRARPEHCPA
jgi:ubiquinone/menaquinone biosynthesis C-methylase UbiE